MGYMTKFEIHAYNAATREPIYGAEEYDMTYELEQIAYGEQSRECFEMFGPVSFESWTEQEMKWYSHEEDMVALSKNHPHVMFMVEGVGEEFPDAWRMWVHNGTMEKVYAEVVYPKPTNTMYQNWSF